MTTAYASAADLAGKFAESLAADVLADAAEIPGTAFCAPEVLAGFVRSMGEPDPRAFAAALCSAKFRRMWADYAAPHPKFMRVPLLAAMAAAEAGKGGEGLLADFAAAKAAAESGRPDPSWRIPSADGAFPAARPARWVRKFSRRGNEIAALGADEFAGMVETAAAVLGDPELEAESLRRAMADRCSPFGGDEGAALRRAEETDPAQAVLGRWFSEAGSADPARMAGHVIAKLRQPFGPWVETAAQWVERTPEGRASAKSYEGSLVGSLRFEASDLAIPKVKALMGKLAAVEAENRAAMAEFYGDAGAERSALMRSGT